MSTPPPPFQVERVGLDTPIADDLYHLLRRTTWPRLLATIVLGWLATNAVFAALYLGLGDAITGARPGSFADAFYFSVQTISTIGYGGLSPATPAADAVVVLESVAGLLLTALSTGMIFAKFATPRAKVLWSRSAVICQHDGRRALMLRVGNARTSTIVEARMRLVLSLDGTTNEGRPFRHLHDLRLRREHTPLFSLTWTAIHFLDDDSPLAHLTAEQLMERNATIIASLQGTEEQLMQTVHARHLYNAPDLLFDREYVDILGVRDDGRRVIDYTKFHDTKPVAG